MKTTLKTALTAATLTFYFALLTFNCAAQANQPGAGNCLNYDGLNNRVEVGTLGGIGTTNNQPFSLECWVLSTDAGTTGTLIGRFYGGPSSGLFSWALMYNNGSFSFAMNNSQVLGSNAIYTGVLDNIYYHVAVSYNGTTANLYVNGLVVDSSPNPGGATNPITKVSFGKMTYAYANDGHPFNGQIDEVRIWNRALTQTEIRNNLCQKLIGNEPGLVGYWRFDETAGNIYFDSSPNGNDGTGF